MLYIAFVCIFCRFFCSLTIKIIFPKKKIVGRSKLANVVLVHGCIFWYVVEF